MRSASTCQLLLCCLLLYQTKELAAQSNAIFNGGSSDGWASLEFAQASSSAGLFFGGNGDGWASSEFAQASSSAGLFNGGIGDGWASLEFAQAPSSLGLFNGGMGDGWSGSNEGTNIQVSIIGFLHLEGPYEAGLDLMRDDLRVAGLIPLTEPYTALGYPQLAGGGGETTNPALLAIGGSEAAVDWVRVELRDAANPAVLVATRQALVRRDGSVVSASGNSILQFGVTIGPSYYVVVRHRNHLGCMTAAPVPFTGVIPSLGYFSALTSTYGTDARKTIGTARVLWAGNVNGDHQLKYTGSGNDRDPILLKVGGATPNSTVTGYWREDVNMDGTVKYTGGGNDRDPILVNVGSTTPNNVRSEQVP